ncbi:SLC13 family permease [Halobacillus salinus]|uniref:SLC13 family permease n=1 Tax=Halobacillus salinus TaxID=192814 RepID=A0A4Z0GVU3_9BACI|nr:SLC13 family permease [Halobacillus salinus]TGB01698.1 SLC13 family permease [Halobacillus salinus]
MTFEMFLVIFIILLMLVGLFFEIARPDLLVFFALFLFIMLGVVSTEEALVGFSNEGVFTIALLFIIASVFERSGLVERFITYFLRKAKSNRGALSRLLVPISVLSAFLNNTPIVATLTPIVRKWASDHDVSPSKFLIPISYASILGGTITLMGTSTNLVIHGLLLDNGLAGFSFFELAIVGLPITCLGLLYLVLAGPKVLPDHRSLIEKVNENTKDYLSELVVQSDFPYIGKTIEEASLRNLKGLYLIEIFREGDLISPVTPETVIHDGDRLIFTGMISTIAELQNRKGLMLDTGTDLSLEKLKNKRNSVQEVVISYQSNLIGKTIKESRFRDRYDAGVLAVHRNDERVEGKIGDIRPKAGDILLLVTGEKFNRTPHEHRDFYVATPIERENVYKNEREGWISLGLLTLMIGLVTFQVLSIFQGMVIAVGIMLIMRMMTPTEAKQSVQFQVLLLIASALGIGNVIILTGTAEWLASRLVDGLAPFGLLAVIIAVYFMTNALTELITNNAAAVIMLPIGLEVAARSDMNPMGIALLIAVAASASFLSPIGYQTNLIVYGPGGYRFKDYVKVGFPLTLIVMATTVSIVYFWVL